MEEQQQAQGIAPIQALQVLLNTAHKAPMDLEGHNNADTLARIVADALRPQVKEPPQVPPDVVEKFAGPKSGPRPVGTRKGRIAEAS